MSTALVVALRPAHAADDALLRALFAQSREADFALLPEQIAKQIIDQQFAAQSAHLAAHRAGAEHSIVTADGDDVGRLIVAAHDDVIELVDLVVATAHRGRGIASTVLAQLCARADAEGAALRLSVWQQNAGARRLYERFGFAVIDDSSAHLGMRREPMPVAA